MEVDQHNSDPVGMPAEAETVPMSVSPEPIRAAQTDDAFEDEANPDGFFADTKNAVSSANNFI